MTPSSVLESVDRIVTEVVAPRAAEVDRDGTFPSHTLDALRGAGLLGLLTGTEAGGLGLGLRAAAEVVERISRACGSSGMVLCMHYAGAAVIEKGGDLQTRRAIAEGRHLSTLAFSEAGSRSHFWVPVSTATVQGDEVVLDAAKSFSTSAHNATAYVWSSRPASGKGLSTLYLVPTDSKGLELPGRFDGVGLRGNDSAPILASGVRVPASARLGPEGGGFDLMMGVVLPYFSVMAAACSIGLMEAAVAASASHVGATRHEHLGSALAELPTIRAYLARMKIRLDQARTLWEDTLSALEVGRPDAMLRVLEVKVSAGEAALEVTATAMRICGGAAFRRDIGVERCFRDAQAATVMAPTSDQLYDFIGKAVAGLPLF